MRAVTAELLDALKEGYVSTLVRCVLKDGTVLAYTDHDIPLTVAGVTHMPEPSLQPAKITATDNMEVGNREFEGGWGDVLLSEADLLAGRLNGAIVQVDLVSWVFPGMGALEVFSGIVGATAWTSDGWTIDIHSFSKELSRPVGVLITPGCRHRLFSQPLPGVAGACRLLEANYTVTGVVTGVENARRFQMTTNPSKPAGWFLYGTVRFTSGKADGWVCEVRLHESGVIETFLPAPFEVMTGDTFSITAGCDKTVEKCKEFGNYPNYGGFPDLESDIQW